MKVYELIDLLNKMPPDHRVCRQHRVDGSDSVEIEEIELMYVNDDERNFPGIRENTFSRSCKDFILNNNKKRKFIEVVRIS
jgi:hypothetical protein